MGSKNAFLGVLLALFLSFTTLIQAQNEQAAVFVSKLGQDDDSYNLTFAVNTHDAKPNELFFYLSGPISNQWTAVGFGDHMKGALMFVIYPTHDGKNVTFSPRIATGHSEPSYSKDVDCTLRNGTGIFDGVAVAQGVCQNIASWKGGSVDFNSTKSPFIYAVGPDDADLSSNAKDAGLRRHAEYGSFTMNLQASNGDPAGFPVDLSKSDNATAAGGVYDDHDYGSSAHAFIMACVFVIIFPFGAAYLRLQSSVRWHWVAQAIGVIGAIIGIGIGMSISQMYNRSKHYNSAHQLIGLLVLALLLVQAALGSTHHWILYKKTPHPSLLSKIHRILGPGVIIIGIVNGGIGFSFASAPRGRMISYSLIILFVALLLSALFLWKMRRDRRKAPYQTTAAQNFQSAYVPPQYQNDIPLGHGGPAPPYSPSRPLYP